MKRQPALVALLLVTLLLDPTPSGGCGIVQSIWSYVEGAEVVALVRIERLEVRELTPRRLDELWSLPRNRTGAAVRVLESWKGEPPGSLELDLGEDYGVGRRPYEVGDTLVVLLESGAARAARERGYQAQRYEELAIEMSEKPESMAENGFPGTRADLENLRRESARAFDAYESWMANRWSLNEMLPWEPDSESSDREALGSLIRLAVKLQADGAGPDERLDWHVAAAERRATRYQGLIELSYLALPQYMEPPEVNVSDSESEEESEKSVAADNAIIERPAKLTREQLQRLAVGFAREQSVDDSDLTMLQLLADYPDPEVDRAAAASIEAGLLLRPIPAWVPAMVEEVLKRYGDDYSARIGRDDRDPRGRLIYTGEGENTLPTIWEVARRELGIPQVPPAEAPRRDEGDEP